MVGGVLYRVYRQPAYGLVTLVVAFITLSSLLLLPSFSSLVAFLGSSASLADKVAFVVALYGALGSNYTILSGVTFIFLALLFGVNTALFLYLVKKNRTKAKRIASHSSIVGGLAAFFGFGCAACGSAAVVALLQLLGLAWLIHYLPLKGSELGLVGVGLLVFLSHSLMKKINAPAVC